MIGEPRNYMAEAFAPAHAVYRERVHRDTWGHLAPKPSTIYMGTIVFAVGEFGDYIVIKSTFVNDQGEELNSSPWYYRDIHDYVLDKQGDRQGVYLFTGTYREYKNGKRRFSGTIRRLHTVTTKGDRVK